ncbi:MAG: cytochrome c oxidase subunit I [Dermatophilaceae bacterium]
MSSVRTSVPFQLDPSTRRRSPGQTVVKWVTTTDHKVIGNLYFITSFGFFMIGGLLALLIRAELFAPGLQIVDNPEQYNQLFTMHGTIMLLLFATPLFAGFANALMPIQIGAPDVAFPRLNMFAYWLYLFGGLIASAGFLTPSGAASFGWFAYAPLSDVAYSPGLGGDLWVFGLVLAGFGTILGGVNFITTIICLRAPGMTMFRMPLFTWTILVTSIMILMAFPVLASALLALGADRRLGAHVFDPSNSGAMLWQHLLGIRGMPRRYADVLPEDGFTWMNQISSVGAFLLGASTIPFLYNVWKTYRSAPLVETDDPWGYGASLEWATSCPPPRHNFESIPRIRSERPAFDLHHPETVGYDTPGADQHILDTLLGENDPGQMGHAREGGAQAGSSTADHDVWGEDAP